MTKKHFLISAPGRTEISGNHTDHQRGCVLAAAVNLETVADVMLKMILNYVQVEYSQDMPYFRKEKRTEK